MRHAPISRIYRLGERAESRDPIEQWCRIERLRRQAWLSAGVIAVNPAELPAPLAEQLRKWAEAEYGCRQ